MWIIYAWGKLLVDGWGSLDEQAHLDADLPCGRNKKERPCEVGSKDHKINMDRSDGYKAILKYISQSME